MISLELASIFPEIPKEQIMFFIGALALINYLGKHED